MSLRLIVNTAYNPQSVATAHSIDVVNVQWGEGGLRGAVSHVERLRNLNNGNQWRTTDTVGSLDTDVAVEVFVLNKF